MSVPSLTVTSATGRVDPKLMDLIRDLQVGDRLRITQRVRVGRRKWDVVIEGKYRDLNFLATGLATQRVPDDDIVMPMLHFTKDNGELSSVALDEHTVVKKI